jgi:hypothetical protein
VPIVEAERADPISRPILRRAVLMLTIAMSGVLVACSSSDTQRGVLIGTSPVCIRQLDTQGQICATAGAGTPKAEFRLGDCVEFRLASDSGRLENLSKIACPRDPQQIEPTTTMAPPRTFDEQLEAANDCDSLTQLFTRLVDHVGTGDASGDNLTRVLSKLTDLRCQLPLPS